MLRAAGTWILLLMIVLFAAPAVAWEASVGWTRSDVGLHEESDGFVVKVRETWPLGGRGFFVAAGAEYAQWGGAQPLFFSTPDAGEQLALAEVSLHVIHPTVSVGWKAPLEKVAPRIYGGAGVVLKIGEDWTRPDGTTNRVYGYEDIDFQLHMGISVELERLVLDLRANQGLLGQLVDRDADNAGTWDKAEDPLAGIATPEDGDTVSSWQIAAGVRF